MAMSTMRQKKLAEEVVKDIKKGGKPRNKQELLESAGYSEVTARATPGLILEQKGTQTAIKVALESHGFSEEGAKKVVEEIMYDRLQEGAVRLRAASEVFKVMGSYAAEKSFNLTATASVDELKEAVLKDVQRFQGNKPSNG